MSTYEPGTLAVATVRGVENVRVFRCTSGHMDDCWFVPVYQPTDSGNGWWPDEDEVTDVRPLVTLDPEDREQLDRLTKALVEAAYAHGNAPVAHNGIHPDTLSRALRSQTKPPKPAEPTGLGAVVEDAEGERYVTIGMTELDSDGDSTWVNVRTGNFYSWLAFDAVRVLSEGVSDAS